MSEQESKCKINRRGFIRQGTSMAIGAASIPLLGAPAVVSARNVNSRINIGFLGTGSRACEILRSIAPHKQKLVTDLCDIYPPHLAESQKYAGNDKARIYDQWEKVLEQKDVDAIAIAAPLFLHVPMSVAALQAGKHVFSEKSMGLSMEQLDLMVQTAGSHMNQVYMVGYQSRLNESLAMVKNLVAEGSLGRITQFYVNFDRNQTWKRDDVSPEWERVLNWRLYKEYCGGLLTEVVTHQIDMVMEILQTQPVGAAFFGKIMVYNDGREHHDSIMGSWEMENGVIGVGSTNLSNASRGSGWTLLGTHGSVECYGGTLKIYWEKDARHLDSIGIEHKFTNIKLGQSLQESESKNSTPAKVIKFEIDSDYDLSTAREFEHFYDCILNDKKPVMDARSCRNTSIAALMAYKSTMEGGRLVTREELVGAG
jgi:predicted dehydrogenase